MTPQDRIYRDATYMRGLPLMAGEIAEFSRPSLLAIFAREATRFLATAFTIGALCGLWIAVANQAHADAPVASAADKSPLLPGSDGGAL